MIFMLLYDSLCLIMKELEITFYGNNFVNDAKHCSPLAHQAYAGLVARP